MSAKKKRIITMTCLVLIVALVSIGSVIYGFFNSEDRTHLTGLLPLKKEIMPPDELLTLYMSYIPERNYKEFDSKLYININNGGKGTPLYKLQLDTAQVKAQSDDIVIVEMDAVFISGDDPVVNYALKLKNENGIWLMDCGIDGYIE